jgi:bifunctional pyridoxal-dependent enzyme with beta-cystathionase and maltose regulon repressor activities
VAATAALNGAQDWLKSFVEHLQSMRDLITHRINANEKLSTIAPDGCYVSFVNITKTNMHSEEFQKHMLEKAKVAVVPGLSQWFGPGANGYVRLSFATSKEVLTEAFDRIENAL